MAIRPGRVKEAPEATLQAEQSPAKTASAAVGDRTRGLTGAILGLQRSHGNRFVRRMLAAATERRELAGGDITPAAEELAAERFAGKAASISSSDPAEPLAAPGPSKAPLPAAHL